MLVCQSALTTIALGLVVSASVANAADVLNIPFSSGATASVSNLDPCPMLPAFAYVSGPTACYVDFPVIVPVGHVIQQIAVVRSTDSAKPFPFISAKLQVESVAPYDNEEKFTWSSLDFVPDGTVDRHRLMTQIAIKGGGILYPDQFAVLPDTMYHVVIQIAGGAAIEGLQVTYQ